MSKCRLCNLNEADKTGSHIVPHFLLKRIENIKGKKGRHFELGFLISETGVTPYYGRSVLPEKLEEIFGDISDEDITKVQHPLVVDNIFCSNCEKRFETIETEYAKTLPVKGSGNYNSGIISSLGILLWGSVLWRMSINGKSGVILSEEQNEHLRNILDTFLKNDFRNIDFESFKGSELIKSVSYRLLRYVDRDEDENTLLLFHPDMNNPLCLFIDEFILIYSLNNNYEDLNHNNCVNSNDVILDSPINTAGSQEVVKPYGKDVYQKIIKFFDDTVTERLLEYNSQLLDLIHVGLGGKGETMPIELKKEILLEITSDEKKLGRKFTKEDYINSVNKVLQKK